MSEPKWSEQQLAIFEWFKSAVGNLIVRARAGTGKTTTIIAAIGHAFSAKILLCAFNKRIAVELQARLEKVGKAGAEAKTLHSLGFGFVMKNWKGVRMDDKRGRNIARALVMRGDGLELKSVISLVAALASKGKGMAPFATVAQLEDIALQFDLVPDEEETPAWTLHRVAKVAKEAMEAAAQPNAKEAPSIDFDDMLFVPVRNGWVRPRYDLVVVDEAQDMNATQLLLAQGVVKKGGRVVIVGDDRQAIYGFRGADSQSLDRLKAELCAQELGLTITYRCPKKVVAAAQEFVPDFRADASAPEGTIRSITEEKLAADVQVNDFVLSRKNAPLVKHCLSVLRAGKRARIEGRDIGASILALVRKQKARDLSSLAKKLREWHAKESKRLISQLGGPEEAAGKIGTLSDTLETIMFLSEDMKTVAELEARVEMLFSDNGTNQVVFSSVHKAKGLEAERVFTLEESFEVKNPRADLHEEANVRYVALTRAKSELIYVCKPEEVR